MNIQSEESSTRHSGNTPGNDLVASLALPQYGFSEQVQHRLINLSENASYRVDDPSTGRTGILRVHRESYHPLVAIESELNWLTALGEQSAVSTPIVLPAADGRRVVSTTVDGVDRYAVLFEVVPGAESAEESSSPRTFERLGRITALMHEHSRSWNRPKDFSRFAWDWEHALGDRPRWGRWQDGIGVGAEERPVLNKAAELIRRRLADYGSAAGRFGLVHADLRMANLLVAGESVNVIDFDDCGFSWYMYDFGAAVSFVEDDRRLPEWQAAWLAGYRQIALVTEEDEDMLATFVMFRRLLLLAWMGSHSHSKESQVKGPRYTAGTLSLAKRFLASGGTSLSPPGPG